VSQHGIKKGQIYKHKTKGDDICLIEIMNDKPYQWRYITQEDKNIRTTSDVKMFKRSIKLFWVLVHGYNTELWKVLND
jgi:hypothetical protein